MTTTPIKAPYLRVLKMVKRRGAPIWVSRLLHPHSSPARYVEGLDDFLHSDVSDGWVFRSNFQTSYLSSDPASTVPDMGRSFPGPVENAT
jgi:hypothetical protein